MTDYLRAYGLPERYFLSLGRMVEKKNLATLIAAYGRYCEEWRVASDESGPVGVAAPPQAEETGDRELGAGAAGHSIPALVFVGSGELESALREQARALGLRVVDRTEWKAGHGLTRINTDGSERLAADRTAGNVDGRMTSAADEAPQKKADVCKPTTEDSASQGGAVYFYGFRQIEENVIFYALAEAFVLPSLKEEWGLVVNEAMACSLPVIVSRTAGCAEDLLPGSEQVTSDVWRVTSGEQEADARAARPYLEERSNGFVFEPTSADALATALRRIGESEQLRHEMGKRSREIVAKFSCENFGRQAMRAAEAARGGGCESGW